MQCVVIPRQIGVHCCLRQIVCTLLPVRADRYIVHLWQGQETTDMRIHTMRASRKYVLTPINIILHHRETWRARHTRYMYTSFTQHLSQSHTTSVSFFAYAAHPHRRHDTQRDEAPSSASIAVFTADTSCDASASPRGPSRRHRSSSRWRAAFAQMRSECSRSFRSVRMPHSRCQ